LNPLGNYDEFPELVKDPYFVTDNQINAKGNDFTLKLNNLSDYTTDGGQDPLLTGYPTINLWQFSKAIGYCDNVSDSFQRKSCFRFYQSDSQVVNNWMNDQYGRDNFWNKYKT